MVSRHSLRDVERVRFDDAPPDRPRAGDAGRGTDDAEPAAAAPWELRDLLRERAGAVTERLQDRLADARARPLALALGLAVAGAAVLGLWVLLRPPPPAPETTLPRATPAPAAPTSRAGSASASSGPSATSDADAADTLTVDIVGAVVHPGLVQVRSGSRVAAAVSAAGGAAADADLERLNLAAKLSDGQRVYVPRTGQLQVPTAVNGNGGSSGGAAASGSSTDPGPPVDLNSANEQQLEALPGVGPATAEAILAYRDAHGPFTSVDELLDVRGIGPAKLAALRGRARV